MWSFYIKFPCGFTVCSSSDMANASSLAATRRKRGWFCTFNKSKRKNASVEPYKVPVVL